MNVDYLFVCLAKIKHSSHTSKRHCTSFLPIDYIVALLTKLLSQWIVIIPPCAVCRQLLFRTMLELTLLICASISGSSTISYDAVSPLAMEDSTVLSVLENLQSHLNHTAGSQWSPEATAERKSARKKCEIYFITSFIIIIISEEDDQACAFSVLL